VRVIAVAVGPSLFRRVCRSSVEFDGELGFLVEVVDVAALPAGYDVDLPVCLGQAVCSFYVAGVAAFERRADSGPDVVESQHQIGAPSEPGPIAECRA
jgi:hypothetical protein